jgi:hypothetical protein
LRVFENRVLRRKIGPKREEVEGGWRRPHSEKFHNLYASPNIIRVIKSRGMKWEAGSVHGRDEKCIQDCGLENMKGRDHLEDLGIDGKIILKWILVFYWIKLYF